MGDDGAERMMFRRRISPARDGSGGCRLHLSQGERALLASLPNDLAGVLTTFEDSGAGSAAEAGLPPSLKRLFPPAYTRDDEAERSYQALARADLLEHHRESLVTMAETAGATALTAEQVNEWLGALNDLRLVIGTILDVTEDGESLAASLANADEAAKHQIAVYQYLSGLQSEVIEFLETLLPDPIPGADDQVPSDPWGEPIGGVRWDGTPFPMAPGEDQ
jgi:hypothetical protein